MGKDGPSPLGIRYHFADMWTEELLKAGGSNADCPLTPEQSLPFVKCWIKIAAMTNIGELIMSKIWVDFESSAIVI